MNGDQRLRLEFAVLLALSLFVLWQMARFVWRAPGAPF
jgi:hypothetical protein